MIRKILLKINDINQHQWLIASILTSTSGIWFSLILSFFGLKLHLLELNEAGNKTFTTLGACLTFVTVLWSFLCVISHRYSEYHSRNLGLSDDDFGNTETIYETINESVVSIIENGIEEKYNYIESLIPNTNHCLGPIKKPCVTIKTVTSEMIRVLSKLLTSKKHNIREKDLIINVFYRFPNDKNDKWHKAESISSERGLSLDDITLPCTTFSDAINSPTHFAYYNDKQTAKDSNHYMIDSEDVIKNHKIIGSIACFYFLARKNDKTYVEFVLSLSTYGKHFTESTDKVDNDNIAYNLKNNVFSEFEVLLKSALLDLYITHIIKYPDK